MKTTTYRRFLRGTMMIITVLLFSNWSSAQLVSTSSATAILCNGGTSTVTVSGTGGTPPYTGVGNFTVSAGPYSYTVTDANSNSSVTTGTVSEPTQLAAVIAGPSAGPCYGLNEAVNGDFQTYTGSITSNNTWINNNLANWSVSHGTPSTNGNLSIYMWSYSGYGEGVYTGYNFVAGQEYQITYDLYQATDANPSAQFFVRLNNNLSPSASGNSVPSTAGTQLVSNLAWSLSGGVQTITETFTASSNYSQLWFYPYLAGLPTPNQAVCTIDNIVIKQVVPCPSTGILCNGGTTDVTVTATGGTAPYTGTGTYTVGAGTHSYTVTDANGCSVIDSISVSEPIQLVATISSTSIDCNGGMSDITVTATGGTAPYTGTGTFTVGAGTHSYTVTDANGCSVVDSITVTEPTQLALTISSTSIDCNGGTADITVTATGGTVPYTGTGTYSVGAGMHLYTVTDVNGCSVIDSITVTEPTQLVATISSTSIDCNGGTADITVIATGGTAPYTGTGTFTVGAGTHSYTVTDANGCSVIDSITVTEPTQLVATISSTPIDCNGGTSDITVTATGGTAPYTGTGTYTVGAGTHSYTVTDANGCSVVDSISVTEPTQLEAAIAGPSAGPCYGVNEAVNGDFQTYTGSITQTNTFINNNVANWYVSHGTPSSNGNLSMYMWSYSGYGEGVYMGYNFVAGQEYQLTYEISQSTDANPTAEFFVRLNNNLSPSATGNSVPSTAGTQVVSNLAWSLSGGVQTITETFTASSNYSQLWFYPYLAGSPTPNQAVSVIDNIVIKQVIPCPSTGILCNGGTSDITVSATGGIAPYTGTGTYTVGAGTHSYTVTDANGCSVVDSITVTEPTQLVAAISSTSIDCNGGTADITVIATGGTAPYTGTGTYTVGAGTHSYTVTDANGCSVIDSITVTEPTQLVATISSTPIDCNGGTSDITVTATGGTAPYTGTGTYTVGAGTHSYTVTDANGCSVVDSITVTEPTQLVATISSTPIDCNGGTSDITVTATGGTAPYTGTGTYSVGAGTHLYTVTDANGCSVIDSILVSEPTQLAFTISSTSIDCNGGTADITVTATGGTAPYTGTGTFTVGAGTHSYTVTDANGCSVIDSITVTEPTQLVATLSSTSIDCNGGTADITVTATGGTAPYTGTGTYSVGAGTHSYTVIDANGCSVIDSITVTEPTQLVASISSTSIDCNGGTSDITVTATGGTAPYTGTGTFTVGAGTHLYTVTDANGCSVIDSITVTEPTQLVASISSTSIDCNGGTLDITVTATGGTAPYTGTGTFTVGAGTHSYTVIDANGCSVVDSITVTEPTQLVATLSSTSIDCNGGTADITVTATGGTAPYTGTGTFTVGAGTHLYTVTDANGCSVVDSITVTEPTQLVATISSTPIDCNGGTSDITVSATGGTAPYTGTGTYTVGAGTYSYTVTDAKGCSVVDSISVTEPTQLEAVIADPSAGPCYGLNEAVNGDFQTYTGNITSSNAWINNNLSNWSVSHGTPSTNGNLSIYMWSYSGYGEGVYTGYNFVAGQEYQITYDLYQATDANPTAEFFVRLNNNLSPSASGNSVPSTAGTQVVSNLSWSLSGGVQTITETFTASSNYSQLWFYPYLSGSPTPNQATCTIDNIVIKQVIPCPSTGILCNGGTSDITVSASGGTAPYTGTGTFTVGAGTHSYTVTDVNNCSEIVTITLTEPTPLVATISSTSINSIGGTSDITVTATGGTAPYTGTGTYTVGAGTYSYTVIDANGCIDVVTTTVSETPLSIGDVDKNTFIRAGVNIYNKSINLSYRIGYNSKVRLEIYDIAGKLVNVVHTAQANEGKLYEYRVNANKVSTGIYFYQFVTNRETIIDRLQIVK